MPTFAFIKVMTKTCHAVGMQKIPDTRNILIYSVSTYICLPLLETSAREVIIFWTLIEREVWRGDEEGRREHGSN